MTAISGVVVSSQRRHEPSKTWRVSDEQGQNNSDVQRATTLMLVMTCLIAVLLDEPDARRTATTALTVYIHHHTRRWMGDGDSSWSVEKPVGRAVQRLYRRTAVQGCHHRVHPTAGRHTALTPTGRPGRCRGQRTSRTYELTWRRPVVDATGMTTNAEGGGQTSHHVHWAKIHASQGKLWTHWRNQKKIKKSTRGYKFTHMPIPHPIFGGHHILLVGSDCERNHTCQISSESVHGFRSPRGRKWPSPIDLAHRPYNSVRTYVLHCDIYITV